MSFPNLDVTPDPITGRWEIGIALDLEAIVANAGWNGREVDGVPWAKALAGWLDIYTDSILGKAFLLALAGSTDMVSEALAEYPPPPLPEGCSLSDLAGMITTYCRGGVTGGASAVIVGAPASPA